ncbi:hypothetical protein HY633_05410 [Candidatus Uhrbacteria bacterium]|nr:hypothetical protein [Candidatus Uhrbacteria bacterium]
MPIANKLHTHLGERKVRFEVVEHKKVFTAYDLAQTLGASLDQIAKTLLVRVEFPAVQKKKAGYYVVVLPASYRLDLIKLKKALKAAAVKLAPEKAMAKLGIEPGALSPFGSLRGLAVVVDKGLLKAKDVFVGAESFTESLRMKVKDYVKVEQPTLASIGKKSALKLQKKMKKVIKKVKKLVKKANKR